MRAVVGGVALIALLFGVGCDELGNPTVGVGARLREGGAETTTWMRAGAPDDARRLAGLAPGGRLHHADRVAPADGALALVTVEATTLAPGPRVRRARTAFLLRDGRSLERRWAVPAGERRWYGLFALPDAPVRAVTRVE